MGHDPTSPSIRENNAFNVLDLVTQVSEFKFALKQRVTS